MGRSTSASLMRAPVAQSTRRSRRSRSLGATSMTASTSCGVSPSGGCQCLLAVDLTERRCADESDSSRECLGGRARMVPDAPVSLTARQSYRPCLRSDSCRHAIEGLRLGAYLGGSCVPAAPLPHPVSSRWRGDCPGADGPSAVQAPPVCQGVSRGLHADRRRARVRTQHGAGCVTDAHPDGAAQVV
jgi:hypothetical protein